MGAAVAAEAGAEAAATARRGEGRGVDGEAGGFLGDKPQAKCLHDMSVTTTLHRPKVNKPCHFWREAPRETHPRLV